MDLSELSVGHFEGHLGEQFTIQGEGVPGVLKAELVEAEGAGTGAPPAEGRRSPFSLVFRGPSEPILPQAVYDVEHDELGKAGIFLVPIAQDDKGVQYQAVFA